MEDSEIVQLYWARSPQAIEESARRYGAYCASIEQNVTGSPRDAEECVNDAWLRAWSSIPPHRPASLRAYLGKLVRNLALNRRRQNTAEKRGGGEVPAVLEELSDCVSGTDEMETEAERAEIAAAIGEFLAALPARQREIFLARYFRTERVRDIAARLGMREGALSAALSRLRARLRAHLTKRGISV